MDFDDVINKMADQYNDFLEMWWDQTPPHHILCVHEKTEWEGDSVRKIYTRHFIPRDESCDENPKTQYGPKP